jgi:hypothetical protein
LRRQSKMVEKRWQRVSWVSGRQPAGIWVGSRGIELSNCWMQFSGDDGLAVKRRVYAFYSPVILECVFQWDCYSSCVKIRCQETDSGDCNRLRTLVFAAVNCKVQRLAVALYYLELRVECIGAINSNIQSKHRLIVTPARDNILWNKVEAAGSPDRW